MTSQQLRIHVLRYSISIALLSQIFCSQIRAQQLPDNQRAIGFWNMRDAVFQLGFNAIDDDNIRMKRM
ncbi:MAG: hypothetical protein ACKOW8_08575, partial [Flavobacteriales bacterium]